MDKGKFDVSVSANMKRFFWAKVSSPSSFLAAHFTESHVIRNVIVNFLVCRDAEMLIFVNIAFLGEGRELLILKSRSLATINHTKR